MWEQGPIGNVNGTQCWSGVNRMDQASQLPGKSRAGADNLCYNKFGWDVLPPSAPPPPVPPPEEGGRLTAYQTRILDAKDLRGAFLEGWCENWRHVSLGMPVDHLSNLTGHECAAYCDQSSWCNQAVYEGEGPWGTACWLGINAMDAENQRPKGSRSCADAQCVDYCYRPTGWEYLPASPPPPAPPAEPPTGSDLGSPLTPAQIRNLDSMELRGEFLDGWCDNWKHLSVHNVDHFVDITEHECGAYCDANVWCGQAVHESEGPWGTVCWLGINKMNAETQRPKDSRQCTSTNSTCIDHCYNPKGWQYIPAPPSPPEPPAMPPPGSDVGQPLNPEEARILDTKGLNGQFRSGWCDNWQHLSVRNMDHFVNLTDHECGAECDSKSWCHQAVYEAEGPWGTVCWLGLNFMNTSTQLPKASRQCPTSPCVDYCYRPNGWDADWTPSPTPSPSA